MQRVRMGRLEIKRDLEFSKRQRPGSRGGQDQKGQPGPRFRVHEERVREKYDQMSLNLKIEAVGSLQPRGIKHWQKEARALQLKLFPATIGGDRTALYLDCINVSIMVIFYYSFPRRHYWKKKKKKRRHYWGKMDT